MPAMQVHYLSIILNREKIFRISPHEGKFRAYRMPQRVALPSSFESEAQAKIAVEKETEKEGGPWILTDYLIKQAEAYYP